MSRRQLMLGGTLLLVGGIVAYQVPLFHIRPLGGNSAESVGPSTAPFESGSADATAYVRDCWHGPLRRGEGTVEITRLWKAFDADASVAKDKYGRQVGLGGAWYFCVRGQGTVEAVERDRCIVTVPKETRRACLELGVIVDNTVREAVGVNVNDFANSQDFNTISSQLNRRVEEDVIKPQRALLKAGVGVKFIGCTKIDGNSDLDPLCLVPIRLDVLTPGQGGTESMDAASRDRPHD